MCFEGLEEFLRDSGIEFEKDLELSKYTGFRTGGKACVGIFPATDSELFSTVCECRNLRVPFYILGNGTNVLAPDEGYCGAVILTKRLDGIVPQDECSFIARAGTTLSRLCKYAQENSLTGLEFAFGIPGSLGGAVFMNAGAYGGEMKDVIDSALVLTADGQLLRLGSEELEFGYRTSALEKNGWILLAAVIRLKKGERDEIAARMSELSERRREKQPLEYPSLGSTFKRPQGAYASALIDSCRLKGRAVGGVCVSEKHAGFIVKTSDAQSSDVLKLIEVVRAEVLEKTGFELEPEIRMMG